MNVELETSFSIVLLIIYLFGYLAVGTIIAAVVNQFSCAYDGPGTVLAVILWPVVYPCHAIGALFRLLYVFVERKVMVAVESRRERKLRAPSRGGRLHA